MPQRTLYLAAVALAALTLTACDNSLSTSTPETLTPIPAATATSPPPEGLVDVGGYKLYYNCAGQGAPTVLMDAGLGEDSTTWASVQPEIAKFTRTCVYDRANLGKSERGPNPRTGGQIVKELHALLANAGIAGPYVLAGHSQGGLHMQMYAAQYPSEAAGLVLVDSAHPDGEARFASALSPEQVEQRKEQFANNKENMTYEDVRATGEQAKATGPLPDVPLVVLAHDQDLRYPSGWPAKELEGIWRSLQEDLAKRTPKGKLVVAENSGHFIQQDQPDLVISAIREVVESAKSSLRK